MACTSARSAHRRRIQALKAGTMFLILAIVLVLIWVGAFTVLHVSSFLIHLLLLFAVISVILHFVRGGRSTV